MVGKSSIRGIAGEQKERGRGEQQRPEGKDPGEMSTTGKTREPQETEESKKSKCQRESVYMDVTGGRNGRLWLENKSIYSENMTHIQQKKKVSNWISIASFDCDR